jgi:hypothetical protein
LSDALARDEWHYYSLFSSKVKFIMKRLLNINLSPVPAACRLFGTAMFALVGLRRISRAS